MILDDDWDSGPCKPRTVDSQDDLAQPSNNSAHSGLGVAILKAKDEQIVNDCVTQLLKLLTVNIPNVSCRWTSHRTAFPPVELGPQGNTKKLTALTDGYLEAKSKRGKILALVEAKADIRHLIRRPGVLYQEAAEIVGWVMTDFIGKMFPFPS